MTIRHTKRKRMTYQASMRSDVGPQIETAADTQVALLDVTNKTSHTRLRDGGMPQVDQSERARTLQHCLRQWF
jgi:hypothetical protein